VPRYLNINDRTMEEYSPDGYSRVKIVDVGLRRKKRKVKKESGLRYSLSKATTRGKERSVLWCGRQLDSTSSNYRKDPRLEVWWLLQGYSDSVSSTGTGSIHETVLECFTRLCPLF